VPFQLLHQLGYLDGEHDLLDFGCGRGSDIEIATELGARCWGWDPYFAPGGSKDPADIVNLGFVLNVIESVHERQQVLRDAFALATSVLVVAVIYGSVGARNFRRISGASCERPSYKSVG